MPRRALPPYHGTASSWQNHTFPGDTAFVVELPAGIPSRSYVNRHAGAALALARAVGEYGSVIFIAGNIPLVTEIAPLLIVIQLEEYNYDAAAAIGIAMLLISFAMLLAINLIQIWSRRRIGYV